jgi:hypothetical protein
MMTSANGNVLGASNEDALAGRHVAPVIYFVYIFERPRFTAG